MTYLLVFTVFYQIVRLFMCISVRITRGYNAYLVRFFTAAYTVVLGSRHEIRLREGGSTERSRSEKSCVSTLDVLSKYGRQLGTPNADARARIFA